MEVITFQVWSIIPVVTFLHKVDPKAPAPIDQGRGEDKANDDDEKEGDKEDATNIQGCYAQVELTDGWYGVTGVLDKVLTQALRKGKIFPGLKLRIYGAKV
jgi:hypothetical protein